MLLGPEVQVDDTTEVRWFMLGQLPPDVATWFSPEDVECLIEHRCDTYRIDHRPDLGVKRRSRNKLELKVRTDEPDILDLGAGFVGRLERWKRWSPADGQVPSAPNAGWVDVSKTIIKRRFAPDGSKLPLSLANRAMTEPGCDLEIVAIELGDRQAWSLAFAAFGPVSDSSPVSVHSEWIQTAWLAQLRHRPWPLTNPLGLAQSGGYPAWLFPKKVPTPS